MRNILLFLAILLGFLLPISLLLDIRIYSDHSILVGDKLYYRDPTFRAYGGTFFDTRPSIPLMDVDNIRQNYPFRRYVQSSFARGEIPWWNPYVGMGVPFIGLGSGTFDPVAALAGFFASRAKLTNVIAVLALWFGACGMFLFLGTLGVSLSGRIFGAVTFICSGWTIVWLGRQNFMAEIWMPWLFWATERLIKERRSSRIGQLALFSCLVCLPGHLQTSFHIFLALLLYVLIRIIQSNQGFRKCLWIVTPICLAIVLGIGIAIIQITPSLDLIGQLDPQSVGRSIQMKAEDRLAAIWLGFRGDWYTMRSTIPTALTAISPMFFGSPRDMNYWWPSINLPESTLYVGLIPLFFAIYGFSKIRESPVLLVWLLLVLLSIGIAFGLPVFNLANYMPGFELINNGRLRLVYRFAIIVAAAFGLDRFMKGAVRRTGEKDCLFSGLYSVSVIGIPVFAYAIFSLFFAGKGAFTDIKTFSPWEFIRLVEVHILVILLVSCLLTLARKHRLVGSRIFSYLVILITFADSFWIFHNFNPVMPSSFVFPETRAVQFLKKDSSFFRVSSLLGKALPANTKQLYGIFDIDLFSVLAVKRYAALQARINAPPYDAVRSFRFSKPAAYPGLINLLNVKYIVVPAKENIPGWRRDPFRTLDQYRPVYHREVLIHQNLEVLPRAFLVHRSRILAPDDTLDTLLGSNFKPAEAVLLEDPSSPRLPEKPDVTIGDSVKIASFAPNQVIVHTHSASQAYLVLSEVYYPGWKATVNGVEKKIYPAYYLFRAVYLREGKNEIVFTFMPESYDMARKISLVCLIISIILLLAGLKKSWDSPWEREQ